MKKVRLTLLFAIAWTVFLPIASRAVAFKMKNDSDYSFRIRCFDRGNWRQWVVFNPGNWGDFATSVTRDEHFIEIHIWQDGQWQQFYYNHHGSRLFTRIVQAFDDGQGRIYLAWWDEPPGCRDAPPNPWRGGTTCLKPSGWLRSKMLNYAIKYGLAYLIGG